MKQHEVLEKNVGLLALFMVLAVSIGGLVQIVPLFFQNEVNEPVEGMKPYTALNWKVVTSTSRKAAWAAIRR